MSKPEKLLMYQGKPLIRKDNTLYYGSMADKFIVMLQVLDSSDQKGLPLSSRVGIYLQYTDPDIRPKDRIVRKSEKTGLYTAMDFASVWLQRALDGKI